METTKSSAEKQLKRFEKELLEEREARSTAETQAADLEKTKVELAKGVEVLKQRAKSKEEEIGQETVKREELQVGMKVITVERDETLELLQRAVEQNEKLKAKVKESEKAIDQAKDGFQGG